MTGAGLSVCALLALFLCPSQVKLTTIIIIIIIIILVLYGFSIAYLLAPGTFGSTQVVEFVADLPEGIKYAGKAVLAAPFAFHSLNGLRHLSWDMAKCQSFYNFFYVIRAQTKELFMCLVVTVKQAYVTGYVVLAATAVSTIALTLIK